MKAARGAADQMAADLGRKFGLSGKWTGNTLHFDRPGVTGSLTITDKDLHLTVTLGFLLKAMRGSLERAIVQELDGLFEKKAAPAAPAKKPASPKTAMGARKKGA
jgi:putative polyhydroxyalkanoate system protein